MKKIIKMTGQLMDVKLSQKGNTVCKIYEDGELVIVIAPKVKYEELLGQVGKSIQLSVELSTKDYFCKLL